MNFLEGLFTAEGFLGPFLRIASYIVLAPLVGGLLAGLDRKVTAWMQGRVGPPVVQPFYDVRKLLWKEKIAVNRFQNFFVFLFLFFMVFSGSLFFLGGSFLLVVFAFTLACLFFVFGGFSVRSPFGHVGAERELIQMMAYDPMVILLAVGFYLAAGSFETRVIYQAAQKGILLAYLPGILAGYLYILTIKFRKSPFDLSLSHHAHQEIVQGLSTEFSGRALAVIEVAHWYENVLLLGILYLFFSFHPLAGLLAVLAAYFLEVFIDNSYARFKWGLTLQSAWIFTLMAGVSNLVILHHLLVRR
jgi:ech hydrogenase subunit B